MVAKHVSVSSCFFDTKDWNLVFLAKADLFVSSLLNNSYIFGFGTLQQQSILCQKSLPSDLEKYTSISNQLFGYDLTLFG